MEMFGDYEQEEIINEFLDIIKLKDYKLELINEKKCCNCKDYNKHKDYCVLDKFQLPDNIMNNIYTYAHKRNNCNRYDMIIENIDNLYTIDPEYSFSCKVLDLLCSENNHTVRKTETKNFVPVKYAMTKLYNESDEKHIDMYKYRLKNMIKEYVKILDIRKKGNKYVCSKERLDKIDFDIIQTCRRRAPNHPI